MLTQIEKQNLTPEEYLKREETAELKSEYRDGEIVPMAGGTTNHNEIAGNFLAFLKFALRGQEYRVFIGDVRLWIPRYRIYTYPDIMVIKGKPIFQDNRTDTVMNPSILVEVLCRSTQQSDRGEKFRFYRSIPEFQEYILIDQYSFQIEQFVKNSEGKWLFSDLEGQDAVLTLESVQVQVPLSDIYERVNFTDPNQESI